MPFLFPVADSPGDVIDCGWLEVAPVVILDVGIIFCAFVDVVIVLAADCSLPAAPWVHLPTAACLPC